MLAVILSVITLPAFSQACIVDEDCDDLLFCNGQETCEFEVCFPGTPPDCDDGVDCTDDTCNEASDTCVNIPNDANCPDDGFFCNGAEFCDAELGCSASGDPCPGTEV